MSTKTTTHEEIECPPTVDIWIPLSRSGYDYKTALNDIADNSLDGLIEKIRLGLLQPEEASFKLWKKNDEIHFIDNGTGIEESVLRKVASAGGGTTKGGRSDTLGLFGMGLKTAAISMAKKVTVTTRDKPDAPVRMLTIDFNRQIKQKKFVVQISVLSDEDAKFFNTQLPNTSGTIVTLSDLGEDLSKKTQKSLAKTMAHEFAKSYSHILNPMNMSGFFHPIKIKVVGFGGEVPSYDPLYSNRAGNGIDFYVGDKDSFEELDYQGEKILVRAAHVKDKSLREAHDIRPGHGLRKNGIYFIRNGRTIFSGRSDLLNIAANVSGFYAEVIFTDDGQSGDRPIKLDYQKQNLTLDEGLERFLKELFAPHLKHISKEQLADANNAKSKPLIEQLNSVSSTLSLPYAITATSEAQSLGGKSSQENRERKISLSPKTKGRKFSSFDVKVGNKNVTVCYQRAEWKGSDLPFDVEFNTKERICTIAYNVLHEWVRKSLIDETNPAARLVNNEYMTGLCMASIATSEEDAHHLFKTAVQVSLAMRDQCGYSFSENSGDESESEEEIVIIDEAA